MTYRRADSKHGNDGAVPANTVQVEEKADCPVEDAEKADSFADDSRDDSDSDNGLVKWCGIEGFSSGGARSHQDLLESEVRCKVRRSMQVSPLSVLYLQILVLGQKST